MKEGQGRASVFIDGEQPKNELNMLERKAKELRTAMTEAGKLNDLSGYTKLKKELNDVNKEMRQIKKETFDVQKVLKNLNGTNLRDLQRAQMQITAELKKMERGTQEYVGKSKQLQQVSAEVRKVKTEMTGLNSASGGGFFGKMAGGFNKYFGMATAAIASFTGVAFSIKKAVDAYNEFEQSVANLSSLTGLVGDDLKFLSDRAKELSVGMTESGVRITSSAVDIVEGFKLMGSARPELLENKEALAQVTEAALVLSAAATIDMQSAVTAVAASMNQFNLTAEDSNMVINALAAGSLKGSAEVADLTEAFANVGTVANYSNMSMEDTVAVLETLAEKQLKGAEAGTQLRSSLISMKAAGIGYQSGVFNMRDAVDELRKKMDEAGSAQGRDNLLIEIFGKRNITVGTILAENIERYDYFAEAVRGTNSAIEQANVNTNTNAAKLAQAKNRAHEVAIELGEKLAPAMTTVTGWGTKMLKVISGIIDFFIKYRATIISVAAAVATYQIIVNGLTLAKKAYAIAANIARIATEGFNKAMSKNIWGAIAAGIALVVTYLIQYVDRTKQASGYIGEFVKQLGEQKYALEQDFQALKNTNEGTEARKKAIEAINTKYGEYLPNLLTEKSSLDEITTAQNAVNDAMIRNIALKSKEQDITKVIEESQEKIKDVSDGIIAEITKRTGSVSGGAATGALMDAFSRIRKGASNAYSEGTKFFTDFGAKASLSYTDLVDDFVKVQNVIANEQKSVNQLSQFYDSYVKSLGTIINTNTGPGVGPNNPPKPLNPNNNNEDDDKKAEKLKKEAEERLKALQAVSDKYSEEFFLRQFDDNQRELEAIKLKYDKELETVGLNEDFINDLRAKKNEEWTEEDWAAFNAYTANRNALALELEDKKLEQQEKLNKAKLSAQEEIWQATLDGEEAEMVSAMQKYDKLFQLAYENGVDTKDLRESMDKEMALIHKKYLDKEVSDAKEAEDKKRKERQKSLQTTADIGSGLLNIVNGIQQIELEKAGENEEKKKAIQKKYADIQMVITIGKIIAATALGAMQAYELGPVAGAIMSGVIIAEGIVEAGYAIAQRNKIKSLAVGGPTGSGYGSPDESGYKIAGVVHEQEYVIPAWERKLPQVMAMERIIESIRVNKGYATGGTATTTTNTVYQPQIVTMTDAAMVSILQSIDKKLDNPTRAKVVYTDFENMKTKVDDVYSTFGK